MNKKGAGTIIVSASNKHELFLFLARSFQKKFVVLPAV